MKLRIGIKKEAIISEYRNIFNNTDISYTTKGAPIDFHEFMMGFLKFQADLVVKRINEVVRRQLYNWSPLSKSWIEFKKKHKLDPRTWYASGMVLKSIHYWHTPVADDYFVGVHPTKRHPGYGKGKGRGARIYDIIRWLEAGTPKMSARPLFTKVFQEFATQKMQTKLYQDYIRSSKSIIIDKRINSQL
jgi:hypothetical protein